MDDGALKWKGKSNAVRICTDSFSPDEISSSETRHLKQNFCLKVSLQKKDDIERLMYFRRILSVIKRFNYCQT